MEFEVERMEPLFASQADYDAFKKRHDKDQVPISRSGYLQRQMLSWVLMPVLPLPKAALVGEDGTLLYSFYHNNDGDPLGTTITAIKDIYSNTSRGCTDCYTPALPDMEKL